MSDNSKRTLSIIAIIAFVIIIIGAISFSAHDSNSTKKTDKQTTTKETPKKETKTETAIETVPYGTSYVEDSSLEYGKTETRTKGVIGEITHTYEITYENGKEISRKEIEAETTKQAVNEIVAKGTAILWHCVDATSYDKNPYNDNKCTSSTGETRYISDSQSRALDPSYSPGQSGHPYYNSK